MKQDDILGPNKTWERYRLQTLIFPDTIIEISETVKSYHKRSTWGQDLDIWVKRSFDVFVHGETLRYST